MAYTRVNWENYPSTNTPRNATNLNKMDAGIDDVDTRLSTVETMFNSVFPIGKVEIFFDNDDHSNYLGFSWQRTSIGKSPIGINSSDTDFNTIGKTGGEKTHTLTIAEMPSHGHNASESGYGFVISNSTVSVASGNQQYSNNAVRSSTGQAGGGGSHNNLGPYEVMAFWKRIA